MCALKAGCHLCWLEILRKFDPKGFLEIRSFNPSFEQMIKWMGKRKTITLYQALNMLFNLTTILWGRERNHFADHLPKVAQLIHVWGIQGCLSDTPAFSSDSHPGGAEGQGRSAQGSQLSPGHFPLSSYFSWHCLHFIKSLKQVGEERSGSIN